MQRQGRLRDAEKIYTRVLKAAPDHFDALNLLGAVKAAARPDRRSAAPAQRRGQEPIRARPGAWCQSRSGRCMRSSARQEALDCLDKARALAPGRRRHSQSARQCAAQRWRGRRRRSPNSGRCWRARRSTPRRGSIAASPRPRSDLPEQALAEFDAALRFAPGHPGAHYNRGVALINLGRYAEAVEAQWSRARQRRACRRLAQPRPGAVPLNRFDEAVASYGKALRNPQG